MSEIPLPASSRRDFLQAAGLGSAVFGISLAGCQSGGGPSAALNTGGGQRPLRACFSNAGLQSTWCALGKKTAELWGRLLNVEIEWLDGEFDAIIVAACPREMQLSRIMARDGASREQAERRIAAQMPIEEKVARADYVIDTSGEYAATNARVDEVIEALKGRRPTKGRRP